MGTLLLMVFGLAVLGIMGYLFMNRLTELNQQVAGLSQQVEGAIKELQVVAEKAEASSSQASRAEERALEAARGRVQAEAEQAAATLGVARRVTLERARWTARCTDGLIPWVGKVTLFIAVLVYRGACQLGPEDVVEITHW